MHMHLGIYPTPGCYNPGGTSEPCKIGNLDTWFMMFEGLLQAMKFIPSYYVFLFYCFVNCRHHQ